MPRPAESPLPFPTDDLRVVTMPNGIIHNWVVSFAEQSGNTIMHADGTVLCPGGPDYRERLIEAMDGYARRQKAVRAAAATRRVEAEQLEVETETRSDEHVDVSEEDTERTEVDQVAPKRVSKFSERLVARNTVAADRRPVSTAKSTE